MKARSSRKKRRAFEGGGAGVDAGEHAAGEGADGAELLEFGAVEAHGHVVDLHEFAGRLGALAVLPASGVALGEVALALGGGAPLAEGAGPDAAALDGALENAPDAGRADAAAGLLALEFVVDAALAAVRAGVARGQHAALVPPRPARPAAAQRPPALRNQAGHASLAERLLPVVVGAARQVERLERLRRGEAVLAQRLDLFDLAEPFERRRIVGLVDVRPAVA